MSLPERLQSSISKEDTSMSLRRDKKEEGEPPDAETTLIQRCVIIQKDEKGYGFTVSGDNPVYVASVKAEGAASRSGVQQGDKILKVNGTLVTNRNHLDVVKLIKAGSYVALTLLGKPNSVTNAALNSTQSFNISSISSPNARITGQQVTAPQPVNAEIDRELWQQKLLMTKAMYETAFEDYQKLQRAYATKPSEKLHAQLVEKERTVKALENQLQSLKRDYEEAGQTISAFPRSNRELPRSNRHSDSEHGSLDSFSVQSWQQAQRRDSGSDIRHAKQSSVPSLVYQGPQAVEMRSSGAAVARSKSDATARKSKATSTFYVPRQATANASEASSLPTTTTATSDLGSMSDSPQTSPSISPTPNDAYLHIRHNGQDEGEPALSPSSLNIITIDDEIVSSENTPGSEPGPFVDIKHLENKPGHMAILLRYLISNKDPSFVLFHLIADAYSRTSGSIKELRKWAYEIYSTFVVKSAPLSIQADDNTISQIDAILVMSATRVDNELGLKNLFQMAQKSIQKQVSESLAEFRSTNSLGMVNHYGINLSPNMDKAAEMKAAEEALIPYLAEVGSDDSTTRVISDRDQATSWAVATFLRLNGKSHHNATLDRVQTFMMKDRRSIKFTVTRSGRAKSVKNHQFNLQHFYNSTTCNFCGHHIWGVGYQGYQCQNCEMALHRQCVDEITDVCGGKLKKRSSRLIPNVLPQRKPSTSTQGGIPGMESSGVRPHSELHSPSYPDSQGPLVQPIPRDDDSELASVLSLIAGIPTGHSVKNIVNRYQELHSPTGPGPGLGVPGTIPSSISLSSGSDKERRSSTDLNRSGSLNNKGEKGDRPARRAKSDVDVDSEAFKAINQSGSSSASSMSNRSGESPSNSTDNVNEMHHEDPDIELEPELPPLKRVLGEDVLRKLKPKEKKRQDVINELIYTERAHLRNLKIMDGLFYKPMLHERVEVAHLFRSLFPNMEEMIMLHESLTKDLKDRQKANPVVNDVGDLLLKRFDGESGEIFRKACAEYCRNQSFSLDALKRTTRKDPKLAQFLSDKEANPLCRRLHLKDLVPSQVHRLTKYPLLIDNLLKYTSANGEEHKRLERALERSKCILAYVNQAVKECENYHRLREIQRKMDKKLMETNDPAIEDIKALDLTSKKHTLIYDSILTMKLKANRSIDVHVLLFHDILVMLQKQDDRYLLKYQNSNAQAPRDSSIKEERYTHSPVLYVRNIMLARQVATEKTLFFVVNMSESRAQMYEFNAATSDLRIKWCDLINKQVESSKPTGKDVPGHIVPPPAYTDIEDERQQMIGPSSPNISVDDDEDDQNLDSADGYGPPAVTGFISESDLIQPDEVSVRSVISAQAATPVRTTEELLRYNADVITSALEERHRLLNVVMGLSHAPSITSLSSIAEVQHGEDLVARIGHSGTVSSSFAETTAAWKPEADLMAEGDSPVHPDGNNNQERTLLSMALLKLNEFVRLIESASRETALQHLQRQQQQHQQQQQQRQQEQESSNHPEPEVRRPDNSGSPVVSPTRRMSTQPADDEATRAEGDSSTQSQVVPTSPSADMPQSASEQPPKAQANVSMPMDQLKGMAVEMNSILEKLMGTMNSGGEERQRWREEIQEAQRKLNALKEQQRQLTLSGAVPPDREPDFDEIESSPTSPFSSSIKPPLSPLSPTGMPAQAEEQELAEETILVSEMSAEEEMHHGIQEAIMDESVETLASSPSSEIATMVGQGDEHGVRVVEVSMGDDDEDEDVVNEVSVKDLPLPDIGMIQASGLDPQSLPLPSPLLLDAVDLDDTDDEDDDNETLVSKGDHPDLSSLSSVSIEGSHPLDSSATTESSAGPQAKADSTDTSRSASENREVEEEEEEVDDSKDDEECTPIEI